MAAFDFPNTPVVGEKFPVAPLPGQVQYTWDGEKWTTVGPQITTALPATELPLMDGLTASVGISSKYAREDHIHMSEGAGIFVAKTGDIMTGGLQIQAPTDYDSLVQAVGPGAWLGAYDTGDTLEPGFWLGRKALDRWGIAAVNPETGANSGSNLAFIRCADDSTPLPPALTINRATGDTVFGSHVSIIGNAIAGASGVTGTYYFGNTGTKFLHYDGSVFYFTGGPVSVGADVVIGGAATYGSCYFGNTGTKRLSYDGVNWALNGTGEFIHVDGGAQFKGSVTAGRDTPSGTYYFGNTAAKYLAHDGYAFTFGGGPLYAPGIVSTGDLSVYNASNPHDGVIYFGDLGGNHLQLVSGNYYNLVGPNLIVESSIYAASFLQRSGGAGALYTPGVMGYHDANHGMLFRSLAPGLSFAYAFQNSEGANLSTLDDLGNFNVFTQAWKPGGGSWSDNSDARIKNELGDYTRGLAEITQLRPIYYTYKGNETYQAPAHAMTGDKDQDVINASLPLTAPYPNSNHKTVAEAQTKYTGLIAQEVEAIFPEMVTKRSAYIDGVAVDDLRDLDTTPLIFALINAVKELSAKVEALEAAR